MFEKEGLDPDLQLQLSSLSPGSQLFKGRSKELREIRSDIRNVSTLIVGSRWIGKTSLLMQVLHYTRNRKDVCPIYMDVRTVRSGAQFVEELRQLLENPLNIHLKKRLSGHLRPIKSMKEFVGRFRRKGMLPVFLFNEIEQLVFCSPSVISEWCGYHAKGHARFVMVGYVSLLSLDDSNSPIFRLKWGGKSKFKVITLAALSLASAKAILDSINSSDLGLVWMSIEDKRKAYDLCHKHTYCVPWAVRRLCHEVVFYLRERKSKQLSLKVFLDVLSGGPSLIWGHVGINFFQNGLVEGPVDESCYKIVVYGIVRRKYLVGDKPAITDDNLIKRKPLVKFGFTAAEAREILSELIDELLMGQDYPELVRWLNQVNLNDVLKRMTLTLVLEPDPYVPDRYAFLMHIVPMELVRQFPDDSTLDGLIIEEANLFLRLNTNVEPDYVRK